MAASRNRSSITGALGVTLSLGLVLASGMSSGATTSRTLWVARYDGSGDFYDGASSVAASPDGAKVIVTGTSLAPGSDYDYATVAYDSSTGAKVWLKRYNGPRNGPDLASSIAISPDGSKVFVTGQSEGRGTNYDYATIAYDMSTGATQWVARYNGPGNDWDRANSIASSPDGSKVFVTGRSPGIETDDDYATVALSVA